MLQDFERAVVRIYHRDGDVMCAGFLATAGQVVTCAHVIARFRLQKIPYSKNC